MNKDLNLIELTLRQLRRLASEFGVSRYSRMRKEQLVSALEQAKDVQLTPVYPTRSEPSVAVEPPQEMVEASKFIVGQEDLVGGELASVDEALPDLPGGYGESRIVLLPRDPQWAYTYWDIPNEQKEELRRHGGQQLALRIYDVTGIVIERQNPHSIQEYPCDELAREWYLPLPVSDRDYVIDIGYRCADGRWLVLARSLPVHVPPVFPSDWVEDHFLTIHWEEELQGKTYIELIPPSLKESLATAAIHDQVFSLAQGAESQRIAGSLYGSQHIAGSIPSSSIQSIESLSSYVFPSGVGLWAAPNVSGLSQLTPSGMGFFSASAAPVRPRQFWLVADAELIVYGATEPDATVTIGGRPIQLSADGTFRFQISFQDGQIDYPIMAVAADGEQTRSIHLKFNRETPSRQTNTKEDAVLEWIN